MQKDLEQALSEHYPELAEEVPTLFRFGTWIGGDRDGNPFVTASVTAATLDRLRPFHAAARIEAWQALAATADFTSLAEALMLHHYDPRYAKHRARNMVARETLTLPALSDAALDAAAETLAHRIPEIAR